VAQFLAHFLTITVGFVAAGVVNSFYELVTARRVNFAQVGERLPAALWVLPVLALAAPYIIMRNAVQRQTEEHRSIALFPLFAVAACCWAFILGGFVLDLALR
jgi:hypothetical protein